MATYLTQQLRSLKESIRDTVEAGVDATEKVHMIMMRKPIAALEKIDQLAAPVHLVDTVQNAVTVGFYRSIRKVNVLSANVAGWTIDRIERVVDRR